MFDPPERSICAFVTAARAVQQCHSDFELACTTGDADGIKIAYEMRQAALDLLLDVTPYPLVKGADEKFVPKLVQMRLQPMG